MIGCAGGERVVIIGSIDDEPVVLQVDGDLDVTAAPFDSAPYQQLTDIEQSGEGVVIVGVDRRRQVARPSLWASRDGTTWRRSDGPISPAGLQSGATAATFAGDGLLVLGEVGDGVALWSVEAPFDGL